MRARTAKPDKIVTMYALDLYQVLPVASYWSLSIQAFRTQDLFSVIWTQCGRTVVGASSYCIILAVLANLGVRTQTHLAGEQ